MRHREYSRPGELACFIGGEQGPQPMQTKLTRSLFLHYLCDDMVMSHHFKISLLNHNILYGKSRACSHLGRVGRKGPPMNY